MGAGFHQNEPPKADLLFFIFVFFGGGNPNFIYLTAVSLSCGL